MWTPIQANTRRAIQKASDYMNGLFDESEELCSYALSLSTFSLLRSPSAPPSPTITQMVAELKTRIINSKDCELIITSQNYVVPYSRKYWRELNLAVRYGIAIRIYASRKIWQILIWQL